MLSSFERLQAERIRSTYSNTQAVEFTDLERATLFKSQYAKDVDAVLLGLDELEKSQDNIDLEKSLGSAVHKYIQKIGDKYIYDKPTERKVTPINDLRDYHSTKTALDSIKTSLDGAPHSVHIREAYKNYNKKAEGFKEKYGHGHNTPEAAHHLRMTVAGMINHVNNRVIENQQLREQGGLASVEKSFTNKQSFTGLSNQERQQCARIASVYADPIVKSTPHINGVNDDPEKPKDEGYNDIVVLDASADEQPDITVVKGEEDEKLRDFHGKGEFDADGLEEKKVAKGEDDELMLSEETK